MSEDNYSLSSRVFHTIRENILSGKYATDEELKEKSIGEELGVSRTPVREALRQLELEGLVTIIPNKRTRKKHCCSGSSTRRTRSAAPWPWKTSSWGSAWEYA